MVLCFVCLDKAPCACEADEEEGWTLEGPFEGETLDDVLYGVGKVINLFGLRQSFRRVT